MKTREILTLQQVEDLDRILSKRKRDRVHFDDVQDAIVYQYEWEVENDMGGRDPIIIGFVDFRANDLEEEDYQEINEGGLYLLDYRTLDAYELDDDYHEGMGEFDAFVKINHLRYRDRWGMVYP